MRLPYKSSPLSSNLEYDEDFQILFDEEQDERFYSPLAGRLIDHSVDQPILIGIAGAPGSGKTAFSRLLAWAIDNTIGVETSAVAIGMDGWHFSNAYLESHYFLEDGVKIPLRRIKGSPLTFDLQAFYSFVQTIREGSRPSYPVYSRRLHDVIQDARGIPSQTRFFLFEGNYLHLDMPGWAELAGLFDMRIFIDSPDRVLRLALRKRHLRGGKDPKSVDAFIEEVDMKNAAQVRKRRLPAHIQITKADEVRIDQIRYLEEF